MSFPPESGPIEVAVAKPAETIPGRSVLAGGALYSVKIDGWRLVINRSRTGAELRSRRGTDLTDRFPEVAEAALAWLEPGTVVDGEVTIFSGGRFDWDLLQHRMAIPGRRRPVPGPAASYLAFDLLAVSGQDLRELPLRQRWSRLTGLAPGWRPPLHLTMQTEDRAEAVEWFQALRDAGVEGIVAKPAASRYRPQAGWVKIKNRQSGYAILGAVIGPVDRPQAVVVGRYNDEGRLVIAGRSVPLDARLAAQIAAVVVAVPAAGHPWPGEIPAGFRGGKVSLTHVDPSLVVEVSADSALRNGRWRHAIRTVRLRPDLSPPDVTTL